MKKKVLLVLTMVALLSCIFALSISADTTLKSQSTTEFGEVSLFDASITVGRTVIGGGFTPYLADGTTYAKVVVGDGTIFYTFPTAYVLKNIEYETDGSGVCLFIHDLSSLNSAMESATGTNPGWTVKSIYRIEMPDKMTRVNGGGQNFGGFENVIEIFLQPNTQVVDRDRNCTFQNCKNLVAIHNLDSFVFRNGCTGGAFQGCTSLTELTLGVSVDVTNLGENMFYGCTSLKSVNFVEAFPNLKTVGKQVFYNCSSLEVFSSNGQKYAYVMQSGMTNIGQSMFYNCDGMKYISISPNVATLGTTAFQNCDNLVFVDFNDNENVFNSDTWGLFQNCKSLLAISLPDNFKYIPNRSFAGCTSLKAVCLPANLTRIDTNNWGEDPFNGCTYLYFVQDGFEVVDENGYFYSSTDFVQPERPDVYYMPNSLSALCTNKTSGKCFTSCYNLNPVIVFGTNMTTTTVGDGIFFECGSNGTLGSGVTAVFLGDMEKICINTNSNRAKGVKYIFANVNDKSLADVNIVNNTTSGYNLNDKTEGFYFCHGNCYYLLNGVKYNGTYSDAVLTKVEGAVHLAEPKRSVVTPEDCENNRAEVRFCFCSAEMGKTEVENTAYGHAHSIFVDLVYADYSKNGYYSYKCDRCDDVNNEKTADPLFDCLGYSAPLFGVEGLSIGYMVDEEAIAVYEQTTGNTIRYGVFVVLKDRLGANDVFDSNGVAADGVVSADVTEYGFVAFDLKIVGFTAEQKDVLLAIGAYVTATKDESVEYSYMQGGIPNEGESYHYVSYNSVLAELK